MKILLTADPWLPVPPELYGGIERILHGIVLELRHRGHTVGLVAHGASTSPADHLFAWPALEPASFRAHLQNTAALLNAAKFFRPHVLHSFSRLLYLSPLLASDLPIVMSYQRHTGGMQIRIAASLGGRSLRFTGCSRFIADIGARSTGEWVAIPNFVDTDFYPFQPTVSSDAPLVFLSRLEQIKGAHTAISIAHAAGRRLLIAGNRPTDPCSQKYWTETIAPHLDHRGLEYIGPVDDSQKRLLLSRAAALVVPIEWDEPFGIVFAEALACGTPVISCPRGALPEIIAHGKHGFLIRSVAEGSDAVAQLDSISRAECRRRAVAEFSRTSVVGQYIALYSDMLAARYETTTHR
jgi:glycosyltransferase involved in cell wall biosynthesis